MRRRQTPRGSRTRKARGSAPEQAQSARDAGSATDLYAIGAILYEALAGPPPVVGSTYNEIIAKLLMEQPIPIGSLRRQLPGALADLIHELLAKTPGTRPTASETVARLRALAPELDAIENAPIAVDETLAPTPGVGSAPDPAPTSVAVGAETVGTFGAAGRDANRPSLVLPPPGERREDVDGAPIARRRPWLPIVLAILTCAAVGAAWRLRGNHDAKSVATPLQVDASVPDATMLVPAIVVDAMPIGDASPPIDARQITVPAQPPRLERRDAGPVENTATYRDADNGMEIDRTIPKPD